MCLTGVQEIQGLLPAVPCWIIPGTAVAILPDAWFCGVRDRVGLLSVGMGLSLAVYPVCWNIKFLVCLPPLSWCVCVCVCVCMCVCLHLSMGVWVCGYCGVLFIVTSPVVNKIAKKISWQNSKLTRLYLFYHKTCIAVCCMFFSVRVNRWEYDGGHTVPGNNDRQHCCCH